MRIKPWIYLVTGIVGGALLLYPVLEAESASGQLVGEQLVQAVGYCFAASVLISLLTYPAGSLALLVAIPLAYHGIATIGEAFFLMLLIAMGLGYLQWYVVLPRVFRSKNAETIR